MLLLPNKNIWGCCKVYIVLCKSDTLTRIRLSSFGWHFRVLCGVSKLQLCKLFVLQNTHWKRNGEEKLGRNSRSPMWVWQIFPIGFYLYFSHFSIPFKKKKIPHLPRVTFQLWIHTWQYKNLGKAILRNSFFFREQTHLSDNTTDFGHIEHCTRQFSRNQLLQGKRNKISHKECFFYY